MLWPDINQFGRITSDVISVTQSDRVGHIASFDSKPLSKILWTSLIPSLRPCVIAMGCADGAHPKVFPTLPNI